MTKNQEIAYRNEVAGFYLRRKSMLRLRRFACGVCIITGLIVALIIALRWL